MTHGDDKGLVLPPKVAITQVVVIPVPYKDANTQGINDACAATVKNLNESGPKDLANNQVPAVRRDNGAKTGYSCGKLSRTSARCARFIQQNLFETAKQKRAKVACVQVVKTWDEFTEALSQKKLILAPWCDEEDVEKDVKTRTKGEMGAAKTLCSPFDQPELPEGTLCFALGKPAKKWTYWGRSY
ncbi:hypothetical protein HAX54_015651 [Datura stramonium]|uniref:Proline-tRNA ligase class II C-terminal domain-containing protein n=1 Tax=Datura stramonium TaxID=4076 RepID=A0ABS8RIX1_DATST|nr:hypothetical protein [Datura stramonium]